MVIAKEKQFLPGQTITLAQAFIEEKSGKRALKNKDFTVIKQYPHHVLTEDKNGIRECFNNAELLQNGYFKG